MSCSIDNQKGNTRILVRVEFKLGFKPGRNVHLMYQGNPGYISYRSAIFLAHPCAMCITYKRNFIYCLKKIIA